MSKRGSTQLLLLFFRSRARLGWGLGAVIGFLVLAALFQAAGDGFPIMARTGLAQALRQSAWEQALSGLPAQAPWPWEDTSAGTSPTVPLLGLSAAVLKDGSPTQDEGSTVQPQPAQGAAHAPRTKLSEVEVGDRITVTTADGSSRVYKVTGRKVVDPHLEDTDRGPSDAEVGLVTCSPLDPLLASSLRLIIQAIKVDPQPTPQASAEQKL